MAITARIEIHISSGETEKCNMYLWNIFERIRFENPEIVDRTVISLAVKGCNDTANSS